MSGKLYLLPSSLSPSATTAYYLPAMVAERAAKLSYFIVENAKPARAELKRLAHPLPLRELDIRELPRLKHSGDSHEALQALLAPLLAGIDAGLISDAGCPAVADPGSELVAAAHRLNITVIPMIGPSSILLALMASGMNGQSFGFHGYLPVEDATFAEAIRQMESESAKLKRTQIFIETPYRNQRSFNRLKQSGKGSTRLCIAQDITGPEEQITSKPLAQWSTNFQLNDKLPAIFLLLAN